MDFCGKVFFFIIYTHFYLLDIIIYYILYGFLL